MTLRNDMVIAQQYTHWWNFAVVLMLVAMCVHIGVNFREKAAPIGILATLTTVLVIATALSMATHHDYDGDARMNNKALSIAERVFVSLTLALALVAFLVLWVLVGGGAPLRATPVFGFLLFGTVVSAAKMAGLYFYGAGFKERHMQGGEPYVSDDFDKWSFYHLQWHLVSGFCAFLLSIALFIVLQVKYA